MGGLAIDRESSGKITNVCRGPCVIRLQSCSLCGDPRGQSFDVVLNGGEFDALGRVVQRDENLARLHGVVQTNVHRSNHRGFGMREGDGLMYGITDNISVQRRLSMKGNGEHDRPAPHDHGRNGLKTAYPSASIKMSRIRFHVFLYTPEPDSKRTMTIRSSPIGRQAISSCSCSTSN